LCQKNTNHLWNCIAVVSPELDPVPPLPWIWILMIMSGLVYFQLNF